VKDVTSGMLHLIVSAWFFLLGVALSIRVALSENDAETLLAMLVAVACYVVATGMLWEGLRALFPKP